MINSFCKGRLDMNLLSNPKNRSNFPTTDNGGDSMREASIGKAYHGETGGNQGLIQSL